MTEWEMATSSDFTVWSYVYDLSGLQSVKLKYRIDKDGVNPISSNQNETYEGGSEVGPWQEIEMTAKAIPSITNPQPTAKAQEYSAEVKGLKDVLVDYYVEATDTKGNVSRSMILHVYVGDGNGGSQGGGDDIISQTGSYKVTPAEPTVNDIITITAPNGQDGIILHWGVNNYEKPIAAYLPEGSTYFTDGKAARTPFTRNGEGVLEAKIGPFNNPEQAVSYISFVTNTGSSWDNNGEKNYKIAVKTPTAISATESADAALVEYYNLQGIRVENPAGGIFIRRQGSSISKVMLP